MAIAHVRIMAITKQGMKCLHQMVHVILLYERPEKLPEPLGILRVQSAQEQPYLAAQLLIKKSLRVHLAVETAQPLDITQRHISSQIEVLIVLHLQVVQKGVGRLGQQEILFGVLQFVVDLFGRHDVNVHKVLQNGQSELAQLE